MYRQNNNTRELSSAAPDKLIAQPACHSSPISYLSSLRESLLSVPGVSCQTLAALLSQPAASESESQTPGAVSG
ncbi:hypothetical protein Tco_0363133 [Tanacetum coccineum]